MFSFPYDAKVNISFLIVTTKNMSLNAITNDEDSNGPTEAVAMVQLDEDSGESNF